MKIQFITKFIIVFLCILFIFLLYFLLSFKEVVSNNKYSLETDGVYLIPRVLNSSEIQKLNYLQSVKLYEQIKIFLLHHPKLNAECKAQAGTDYLFQDYIWIIEKSAVHTCHRDNNGDFFNKNQKYPSYTVLVFIEPMEKCLGVIPCSHLNKQSFNFNYKNNVVHLPCDPGDAIIFNANIIHVGAINREHHLRYQLKYTHKDDIPVLDYYQDFNKILKEENNLPMELRKMQKNFSCHFPILSNLTQSENIRTSRGSQNGVEIGPMQKMFSLLFYGNSRYYDLPNAF